MNNELKKKLNLVAAGTANSAQNAAQSAELVKEPVQKVQPQAAVQQPQAAVQQAQAAPQSTGPAYQTYEQQSAPAAQQQPQAVAQSAEGQSNPQGYTSPYQAQIDELYQQITGRQPFSYNINEDAMWQSLKDDYQRMGKQAMRDTMGRAAGLTGGYGSSYGQAVGQAAYDEYLTKLSERAPELYEQALNRYQQEGDELKNRLSLAMQRDSDEYNRFRNERAYADERADVAYQRQLDERDYRDRMDERDYQRQLDERDYNYKVEDRDYNRRRYEQEYADERGDVEYNRRMQERSYQDERADVDYNRRRYEQEYADERGDVEYNRRMQERSYQDSLSDKEYQRQQNARSYMLSLIQYGYQPTDDDLAEAGMTREEANQLAAYWQAGDPDMAYRLGLISGDEFYRMTGEYPAGYTPPAESGGGSASPAQTNGGEREYNTSARGKNARDETNPGRPGGTYGMTETQEYTYGDGIPPQQFYSIESAISKAGTPEEAQRLFDKIGDGTFSNMSEEQVRRLDQAMRKAGL